MSYSFVIFFRRRSRSPFLDHQFHPRLPRLRRRLPHDHSVYFPAWSDSGSSFTLPRGLSLAGLRVRLLLSSFLAHLRTKYLCRIVVLHINTPVSGLVKGQATMVRFTLIFCAFSSAPLLIRRLRARSAVKSASGFVVSFLLSALSPLHYHHRLLHRCPSSSTLTITSLPPRRHPAYSTNRMFSPFENAASGLFLLTFFIWTHV